MYSSRKGGNVTIKCDIQKFPDIKLSELSYIGWIARHKNNTDETVIRKYIKREAIISTSFTGRVELVNGTSLKISRLQTADEMKYICAVQLRNKDYGAGPFNQIKVNC